MGAKEPRVLTARSATMVVAAYLGAQIICGILIGAITTIFLPQDELTNGASIPLWDKVTPFTPVFVSVLSGLVMIGAALGLGPRNLKERTPSGAAWVMGRRLVVLEAFFAGLMTSLCYTAFAKTLKYRVTYEDLAPLEQMALLRGMPQISWLLLVLVLAPLVEELLFRGVFYGGCRKTYGAFSAAILTTFVFILFHLPQIIKFPPIAIGLTSLGLLSLWYRLRSAAIGPSVSAHIGYNTMFAINVVF